MVDAAAGRLMLGPPLVEGRDDVEEHQPLDSLGSIESQAVGDARAPVMPHDAIPRMAQMGHQAHHVAGHAALGVGAMLHV